jgi:hypothetical protein
MHLALIWLVGASACLHTARELDTALAHYGEAQKKVADGFVPEGIAAFKTLLQQTPWLTLAHYAIGRAEDGRSAWIWAYISYRRYVAAVPAGAANADVRKRMAELEVKVPALKDYADAEREAQAQNWPVVVALCGASIAKKPNFALAHKLLGVALSQMGKGEGAAAAFRAYLDHDPDAPDRVDIERRVAEASTHK